MSAVVEDFKYKQQEWIECPICTHLPRRGPIYSCRNGHILCKDCQAKLTSCPTCREQDITCRSLIAEKVLENLLKDFELKCKFTADGCTMKGLVSIVESHEVNECLYRPVKCPLYKCNWNGPLNALSLHVANKKCAMVLKPRPNAHFVRTVNKVDDVYAAFYVNYYPYLLETQYSNDLCCCHVLRTCEGYWCIYVKSITQAKSTLRVMIRLQKPGENRDAFIYIGEVASSEASQKKIVEKGKCLMLRDNQVKNLNKGKDAFEFSIRIFKVKKENENIFDHVTGLLKQK